MRTLFIWVTPVASFQTPACLEPSFLCLPVILVLLFFFGLTCFLPGPHPSFFSQASSDSYLPTRLPCLLFFGGLVFFILAVQLLGPSYVFVIPCSLCFEKIMLSFRHAFRL